ncbi:hypothetical protein CYMTET_22931 [Cymbomonas tetramitiformis]|uniref:Aspartate racemase n=1 Tax=Cymbomonas tetramitiformis TaxID=36881 RepID=A0AAE0FYY4_9CHLO|nr:hypothetical protein CYMTET_22931 [Cymbomonas tetramitiformis]|eukprot:gene26768-32889_t
MDAKVAGVLTGVSYVSGIDYYKGLNEAYAELVPKGALMPRNPLMIMVSVDCDEYAQALVARQWDKVKMYLADSVSRLVGAKCDFLCIASNTAHMCVPEVQKRFPELPVLHIADCTAQAIKKRGFKRIGLLGTEPTMRENYLKDQIAKHNITTIIPDDDVSLNQIFTYIMKELGVNVFKAETRAFFVDQIHRLVARGAEGVILGCTEIELLVKQEDVPEVPLFNSAELHIAATAKVQAGILSLDELTP